MEKNEGKVDRILRFIFGVVLILFIFTNFPLIAKIILLVIGIILIITSITGFCLIYKLLGINTLKK